MNQIPKLSVELVPESSWGSNLRSMLSRAEWDVLRKACYKKANYRCEICGGQGRQHPVECHEVWEYNDQAHVQKLIRLIALCPACHEVKHMGRAEIIGRGPQAFAHLLKANNWTPKQAQKHISEAQSIWEARSEFEWKLDISILKIKN